MMSIVNGLDEANYWIPCEGERDVVKLTKGKLYKIETIETSIENLSGQIITGEEYWIKDDNDKYYMPWYIHKGVFVKTA